MRILQLTSHLNVGGVTSSVVQLSAALARRRHRVMVASETGPLATRLRAEGVAHWRLPIHTSAEFSPRVWWAGEQLQIRLQREPVDLLHAHTRVAQVLAQRLAERFQIPWVATWHGFFRPNMGRRLWPCTGDRTIAISDPVREHLIKEFRVPPQQVVLIPHGIDPGLFSSPDPVAQQGLRAQCDLPKDSRVVGTVARLVRSKGVDVLIRAVPALRAAVPNVHVLIVGDGPERGTLESLAASLGVSSAVHFSGALERSDVALSLMEVFAFLPADHEGFGLSLLEAMASARPIVAVQQGGGSSWVLEESGIGQLIDPRDSQGMAEAMVRWLQDPATAQAAGRAARETLEQHYTLQRMVSQVESVYAELIS